MNDKIKFSVIVPTYGVGDYIGDALGCLMMQTYDNFEVIIVDDCSPDKSGDIARTFVQRDDRFIYIRHDTNQGVSAARNTGIDHATGDYILFLDPDDLYERNLLRVCAAALQRNQVDLLVYSFTEDYRNYETGKMEYRKGITLELLDYDDDVISTNDPVTIHRLAMQMEEITMLGYPWNKCYKTSVVKEHNLRFQKIKHVEDILFNCDMLDYTESLMILNDVLYHYRNQGQMRLTGGEIDDYFELQKIRVKRIYEQQQKWKTCDFEVLGILAKEYFRSFQSAMVRQLETKTKTDDILAWCKKESQTELFQEFSRYLPSDSKTIKLLYKPIADGMFGTALRRARLMKYTKQYFPGVFNRAKQIR
ncbi:glycosyltransferase family 2 protein [Pseudobutyrivibrio xylanivorans]|uniref:Glycosyl transferase family 2 n=1 Tax=Pseudobutyrivibrio xylanivorans TaxID=185007 RepID=A0A5P6VTL0_PSEXY|nr:glycosyltransferase family 2 protein [Pseudobutyrivibrio xylanivorans]QFJ56055.1 glycosyl transferase family 2 [Pseudobutyrivibrio xylanivorans]